MASKLLLSQLISYKKEYNFNAIYLIPTNLYGPEDHFNPEIAHVIPSLILKVNNAIKENKESIEMWGSGNASREFLYVKDVTKAIIQALKEYNKIEPLNIGTGIDTPLKEIVNIIVDLMDYKGEIKWDSTKPEGQLKRCFDVSKLKEELNFTPETTIEDGLKATITWYKENETN
jgi:GDP-L-fucose synthase